MYYYIPENFAEGGKVINGMFDLRKLVEGAIIGGIAGLLFTSMFNWYVGLLIGGILLVIGTMGIMGMPLSRFCQIYSRWRKERGIRLYNPNTKAYAVPVADMALSNVTTLDAFSQNLAALINRNSNTEEKELVENKDFVFGEEAADQLAKNTTVTQYIKDEDNFGGESGYDFPDFE